VWICLIRHQTPLTALQTQNQRWLFERSMHVTHTNTGCQNQPYEHYHINRHLWFTIQPSASMLHPTSILSMMCVTLYLLPMSMQGLSSVFNLHGLGCFLPLNVKLHCARSIYHCIMSFIHSCCITEIFPFGDIQYCTFDLERQLLNWAGLYLSLHGSFPQTKGCVNYYSESSNWRNL
jgi:hypothetical protein